MAAVLGLVGVALAWALAGAQWWRARTSAAGVSVLSWSLFLATNTAWLAYAVGTANPYLALNCVGSAALNSSLLWRIDPHRWRSYALVSGFTAACAVVGVSAGWAVLAAVCFASAFTVRWPQLVRALRAEDLSGISLASWQLALFNNSVWVAIGLQRGDAWFAAAQAALAASTVALIATVVLRRRRTTGLRADADGDQVVAKTSVEEP